MPRTALVRKRDGSRVVGDADNCAGEVDFVLAEEERDRHPSADDDFVVRENVPCVAHARRFDVAFVVVFVVRVIILVDVRVGVDRGRWRARDGRSNIIIIIAIVTVVVGDAITTRHIALLG